MHRLTFSSIVLSNVQKVLQIRICHVWKPRKCDGPKASHSLLHCSRKLEHWNANSNINFHINNVWFILYCINWLSKMFLKCIVYISFYFKFLFIFVCRIYCTCSTSMSSYYGILKAFVLFVYLLNINIIL